MTHGVDAVVTRGSNTYGPYHHPEKLIPLFVTNAIDDRPLPLYGDGLRDATGCTCPTTPRASTTSCAMACRARPTTSPGGVEMANRDTVGLLLEQLGKPWSLVRHVEDRPGHDRRYAMDGSKLAALGWRAADDLRGGPGLERSTGSSPTSLVASRPARATGTPTTSGSTARACAPRPDARRRHRSTGRLGRALIAALATRRSPARRPDRLDPRRLRP